MKSRLMQQPSTSEAWLRATRLRVVIAILLLAAFLVGLRALPVERPLAWLTQQVQALGIWGPLAFVALYVVTTVFLLPATPVSLAAGAVFGTWQGGLVILVASLVSAAVSFFFSRYVAHDRVAATIHHYPKLEALWHALGEKEGWKIVVAVRLSHALPFGLQNLLFGLSPIRFWPFLLASCIAALPGSLLYGYLGHLGAEALGAEEGLPPGPLGWILRVGSLLVIALAVLYITRFARRIIREKTSVDLGKDPLVETSNDSGIPDDGGIPKTR